MEGQVWRPRLLRHKRSDVDNRVGIIRCGGSGVVDSGVAGQMWSV